MNPCNPLMPAILVSQTQVHRQDANKVSQVKQIQALATNIAATTDRYEHTVESTELLAKSHEDKAKKQPPKPRTKAKSAKPAKGDKGPHLDVTA